MPKPVVHYRGSDLAPIEVGKSAHVYTLDHPYQALNHSVYGVQTSTVVRVDEDGTFETLNSIYVPAPPTKSQEKRFAAQGELP